MPWSLISGLNENGKRTQSLHSPGASVTFWPATSMSSLLWSGATVSTIGRVM